MRPRDMLELEYQFEAYSNWYSVLSAAAPARLSTMDPVAESRDRTGRNPRLVPADSWSEDSQLNGSAGLIGYVRPLLVNHLLGCTFVSRRARAPTETACAVCDRSAGRLHTAESPTGQHRSHCEGSTKLHLPNPRDRSNRLCYR